jgi:hypothetical protein
MPCSSCISGLRENASRRGNTEYIGLGMMGLVSSSMPDYDNMLDELSNLASDNMLCFVV